MDLRVIGLVLAVVAACADPPDNALPARRDAGTGTPVTVGDFCAERCVGDSDCLAGHTCTGWRCTAPVTDACATDGECRMRAAGWGPECNGDNYCGAANHLCISVDRKGYCARHPTTPSPCLDGEEEMAVPHFGASDSVTVCGRPRARCDGVCFTACVSDADCGGEHPACNATTGKCQCTPGSCRTNASACEAGRCRCAADADCTVASDKCFEGSCGCSSAAVCPAATAHPGTAWVCE